MSAMSRTKGKVGEREVAQLLRDHGFEARRGVQFQGGPDSPDVIGLPGFHVEVKRTEAFRLYPALEQAKNEKREGDVPAVFHRANSRPWVVVMDAADFLALVRLSRLGMAAQAALMPPLPPERVGEIMREMTARERE